MMLSGQGEGRKDPLAPTDKSVAWTSAEMADIAREMATGKTTTHRFFGEKGCNREVRRLTGPQPIPQHAKKADFMVIQDDEGTCVSGGQLVNARPAVKIRATTIESGGGTAA